MLSSVIAAHHYLTKHHMEMKVSTKMRSKIVSREHLNEWERFKSNRFIESKVPVQHFGENIHGNIFESLRCHLPRQRLYLL
jgi:ribonuclease-3